jgi:hypothetical protein
VCDLKGIRRLDRAVKARHDPGAEAAVKPEWIADHRERVADRERPRAAEAERMQRQTGRVNVHDRRVDGVVLAEDGGAARAAVLEGDVDRNGPVDHVRGGDDVSLAVEHEPGPERRCLLRRWPNGVGTTVVVWAVMSNVAAAACAYTAFHGPLGEAGTPAVAGADAITVVVRELVCTPAATSPSASPTAPPSTTSPNAISGFELLPNATSNTVAVGHGRG